MIDDFFYPSLFGCAYDIRYELQSAGTMTFRKSKSRFKNKYRRKNKSRQKMAAKSKRINRK